MLRKSRILFTTALSSTFVVSAAGLYWFMGVGVIPECRFQIGTGERLANRHVQKLGAIEWPPLLVPIGQQITLLDYKANAVPESPASYFKCAPDSGFVTSEIKGRQCINIKMLTLLDRLRVIRFQNDVDGDADKQVVSLQKGPRWRIYEEVLSPHQPNEYHLHLRWFKELYRLTNVRTPKSNGDVWAVEFEYLNTGDLLSNALFRATGTATRQTARLEGICQTREPKGLVVVKNTLPNENLTYANNGIVELAVKQTPDTPEKQ